MIIRVSKNFDIKFPGYKEYHVDKEITIEQAVETYGDSSDTIRLYTDDLEIVGIASWPFGGKGYVYFDKHGIPID